LNFEYFGGANTVLITLKMFQLKDLLKEGHKHLTGLNEVVLGNIDAVKQLSDITRTSLGPNGMNKMLINDHGKLSVTSDAATIVKELDVFHPAAKLAVLASQMQEMEMGDGTNFVITFCGELLQNAQILLEKGLHISEIIAGYSKAGDKSLKLLEELVVKKVEDVKNVEQVLPAIRSAISSKQSGYENLLAPLVAKACVEVCPSEDPRQFNVDNVRTCKILGGGVVDTNLVKGFVLNRGVEGTIKHLKDVKVAVFAGGFETAKPDTKDTVLLHSAEQLLNYTKSEEQLVERNVKEIYNSGARVIVSGGSVSEMALHFIERYKLMVIKVQSKFDLRRLCKAVGAIPLVRMGTPTQEELGYADQVSVEEIGSDIVTVFTTNKSGLSTIVIRASTQNLLDDFERAIDDGVNVYKVLCRDSRLVAGAGACDIELAKRLAQFGEETPGLIQYAIKKYADAFEVVPRTLAENSGMKATDALSNLYAAHQGGNIYDGIDVENLAIKSALEKGIFDVLSIRMNAIRLATNAAVTILRIDQIIMSKPAGGPKVPQQGPVDTDD
jgi:T-complex protein 1 subunit theta